jgi:hypothetical protein
VRAAIATILILLSFALSAQSEIAWDPFLPLIGKWTGESETLSALRKAMDLVVFADLVYIGLTAKIKSGSLYQSDVFDAMLRRHHSQRVCRFAIKCP